MEQGSGRLLTAFGPACLSAILKDMPTGAAGICRLKGRTHPNQHEQWRVCFEWVGNDAHEVEIVDCH